MKSGNKVNCNKSITKYQFLNRRLNSFVLEKNRCEVLIRKKVVRCQLRSQQKNKMRLLLHYKMIGFKVKKRALLFSRCKSHHKKKIYINRQARGKGLLF
jgi:hypothetical protein